jgi:hypothetical protein
VQISETTPDEFLATIDEATIRADMRRLDELLVAQMPGRRRVLYEGTFWGGTEQHIIGYGVLVQPRPRGEDVRWFIVGLARQKASYSLYVNAVADGAYLGRKYADRLGKVKMGSASIGFRSLDDVDLDVLEELATEAHRITPPDP